MSKPDRSAIGRVLTRVFAEPSVRWERTSDGVSTEVYRIVHGAERFYLRLPVDDRSSFAAEVAVHTELRRLGVAVPEVVHYESFNEELRRSVMVTTEVPGRPMISYGHGGVVITDIPAREELWSIYRAAGRDLAVVNQVPVNGFGRVRSDLGGMPLQAEHRDFARWAADFDADVLRSLGFSPRAVMRVEEIVADEVRHAPPPGHGLLAHGDFYVTQVFHRHGQYTGMIDFGDIQGSNGWYDLATFRLSDPEQDTLEEVAVSHLEAGYAEVADVPADSHVRVRGTAVTIMADRLTRQYLAEGEGALQQASFRIFRHHLDRLLRAPTT